MNKFSRIATVIALSTACAMPVMAQSTSGTSGQTSTPATQTTSRDNELDYGWIGLLGLAGLLGLRRKTDTHRDGHATPAR